LATSVAAILQSRVHGEDTEIPRVKPPRQPAKKKGTPGKKNKPDSQPQDIGNDAESRRSSRKRAVATLGPKILVDPSQPPPKRVK